MSQENVEIVLRGNDWFRAHGAFPADLADLDFVWDMSHFHSWLEVSTYEGMEGANAFITEWTATWDGWRVEIQALHDAGEKVVAVVRQRGRSKVSGMRVEMYFAMVWTLRNGKLTRVELYSDPAEALRAVGLEE